MRLRILIFAAFVLTMVDAVILYPLFSGIQGTRSDAKITRYQHGAAFDLDGSLLFSSAVLHHYESLAKGARSAVANETAIANEASASRSGDAIEIVYVEPRRLQVGTREMAFDRLIAPLSSPDRKNHGRIFLGLGRYDTELITRSTSDWKGSEDAVARLSDIQRNRCRVDSACSTSPSVQQ